jgi:preprotein translocase subunit SecE
MAKNSNKQQQKAAAGTEKKAKEKTTAVAMAEKRAAQKKKQGNQKQKGRIKEYFKGVKLEMRKVVWPTRKELGAYTAVVIATCAAFALLFWGVDSAVLAGIKALCF